MATNPRVRIPRLEMSIRIEDIPNLDFADLARPERIGPVTPLATCCAMNSWCH